MKLSGLMAGLFILLASGVSFADQNPQVKLETSEGPIVLELFAKAAPVSCQNFLNYVKKGYYDGTLFHRVIKGFMIQGGGFTTGMVPKKSDAPIKNEATNGLKNTLGTVAMARTSVIDSATGQFFINTFDNQFLDHQDDSPQGYGYAVFGKVVQGMDIVEKIQSTKTVVKNPFADVPEKDIAIKKASLVEVQKKQKGQGK